MRTGTSDPEVTVVIPVWRADPAHLREALASVLGQTLTNFEVIVVEDPSEHPAESLVRAHGDPRIRYILNERRTSIVQQHNLGVSLARAPLIARFDADDVCEPSRLRLQKDFLDANPGVGVVGSQLVVIDWRGSVLGVRRYPTDPAEIRRTFRRFNPIANPAVMFRRVVVDQHGGWTEGSNGVARDYEWYSRLATREVVLANLEQALVRYRLHRGSLKQRKLRATLETTWEVKRDYWLGEMSRSERLLMRLERLGARLPAGMVLWLFQRARIRRFTA